MLEAILKKFNLQEILKPATSEMSEDKCKNLNTWKMQMMIKCHENKILI